MTGICPTHIICFGNPLHGDDGFGTAVFNAMESRKLPDNIKVMDGGTSSLSALNLFDGCRFAIIVDACYDETSKGVLRWGTPDEFILQAGANEISSHGLGVGAILQGLQITHEDEGKKMPTIDILTCTVEMPTSFNMSLSDQVSIVVPKAVQQIIDRVEGGFS